MEPTHDSLQAQGSRELEGTKARGRPACSWEFTTSAYCKRLDKEDLWMRFAILFSQWRTHLSCSISWRLTSTRGSMHTKTHKYYLYVMFSGTQQKLLKEWAL